MFCLFVFFFFVFVFCLFFCYVLFFSKTVNSIGLQQMWTQCKSNKHKEVTQWRMQGTCGDFLEVDFWGLCEEENK